MPRQNRRRPEDAGDLDAERLGRGAPTREPGVDGTDGEWLVRTVTGAGATKPYRCPGCDQEIAVGVPHLVVWPDDVAGTEHRRHWHTPCWRARSRRGPVTLRSRNAPRY